MVEKRIDVEFELEKATKNTYRYVEVEVTRTPLAIGYIYIQKSTFGDVPPPERLIVSLNWEEK